MGDATAVVAYKGFNRDFTCRGFWYQVGETYEHDGEVKVCKSGFHACEHPLDVFSYYAPATSRFASVIMSGEMSRDSDDKIAASRIMIEEELSLPEMIKRAVEYVFARSNTSKNTATGYGAALAAGPYGAALATGDCGTATASGTHGAASAEGNNGAASTTGLCGAASATGERGAAIATGYYSAALATAPHGAASATGEQGAASATGERGAALATGTNGAATASGCGGAAIATGHSGEATASGYCGAAVVTDRNGKALAMGDYGAAIAAGTGGAASTTGERGAALATGRHGRASGDIGCALFLVERAEDGTIIHAWAGIVGRDGIKPDVFYMLRDGKPVEVED